MGGIVRSIGGALGGVAGALGGALPIVSPMLALTQKLTSGDINQKEYNDQVAGLDPGARPGAVGFESITDNKTGQLKDQYKLSGGEGYSKLADERLATDTAQARNTAAQGQAGAQAQARTALSSKQGMTPAMAMRLAAQGQRDQMGAQQDITQGQVRGGQDVAAKQFDLGREAEKANLGSSIGDQQARNNFNMDRYKTQMGEWAAGKAGQSALEGSRPKSAKGGIMGGVGSILGK
jgi:hypothetical protein